MPDVGLDEKKHSHLAIFYHMLCNGSITRFMKLILISNCWALPKTLSLFSLLCNTHTVHANPPTQMTSNLVVVMETVQDNIHRLQGHNEGV